MYKSIFNYLPQIDLNDNLWIMFKGWGLLVSHKALDDWSVISQGKSSGCTVTMMTMRQVRAIEWLVNQTSNGGGGGHRSRLSCSCFSQWIATLLLIHGHGNLISGRKDRRIPWFKHMNNPTLKTNLNIYVIILISLTVLNGTAAILSSQTWPY